MVEKMHCIPSLLLYPICLVFATGNFDCFFEYSIGAASLWRQPRAVFRCYALPARKTSPVSRTSMVPAEASSRWAANSAARPAGMRTDSSTPAP